MTDHDGDGEATKQLNDPLLIDTRIADSIRDVHDNLLKCDCGDPFGHAQRAMEKRRKERKGQ